MLASNNVIHGKVHVFHKNVKRLAMDGYSTCVWWCFGVDYDAGTVVLFP